MNSKYRNARNNPEVFWSMVAMRESDEECWLWLGAIDKQGYGKVGNPDGKTQLRAHRLALIHSGTEVPVDTFVLHSCDNKRCCNPAHLRVGSPIENIADRRSRQPGSWAKGERVGTSRLTEGDVLLIRHLFSKRIHQTTIAKSFGIAQTTVSAIVNRKIWTYL